MSQLMTRSPFAPDVDVRDRNVRKSSLFLMILAGGGFVYSSGFADCCGPFESWGAIQPFDSLLLGDHFAVMTFVLILTLNK